LTDNSATVPQKHGVFRPREEHVLPATPRQAAAKMETRGIGTDAAESISLGPVADVEGEARKHLSDIHFVGDQHRISGYGVQGTPMVPHSGIEHLAANVEPSVLWPGIFTSFD
jgi:hypothetical protein